MFPKEFQHLNIPLGDIKSATNEFGAEKCIGEGGFGKVYKGELMLKDELTVVAVKRLNSSFGQGIPEFWREIMLLSRYKHENIVSLLGFCNEGGENILVYEYLSKRSLDLYIRSADLSWDQRLRICIGAAYGLQYLHDPKGSQQRVLHRDIKSGNILLDENWKPKIADFGLSKYGPANQQFTFLFTNAVGTMGYCDPLYVHTGYLTKESDVYSFGVVLFEVLCGRHCVENYQDIRRFLPVLARKCYEEKTLDTIICSSLRDQISPLCLEWFSKIAYNCLQIERTARPLVGEIVTSLETALQYQRTPENGNAHNGEARVSTPETVLVLPNSREPEYEEKPQKSSNENIQENQDLLIKCITKDLGFSSGKPVAACLIYKSLLHWKSFEVERAPVLDRIIQTIASTLEIYDSDTDVLGYWLCNTSTMLTIHQHTLKASEAAHTTPQRRRSSSALLFKQQLTAFLVKIYGMIRDRLKKEISPLLGLCIHAPRTSRGSLAEGHSQANAIVQRTLIAPWQSIFNSLDNYLKTMKANFVPPFLVRKLFTQIFSYINVQLFNSLLLRRECCSFGNGEYVKSGLAELEQWCCNATEEYAGTAWDELKHIRQAVGFLVIHQKPEKTLKEITTELCPVLSIQQLYRISTTYWDDKYGTHSVSSEVISSMRVMTTEDSNNDVSSSFLLDDDSSSLPFSVDDMSKSMPQVDIGDIELPPQLDR